MSAFGGKADIDHSPAARPLIAISGHWLPDGCGGKSITTAAQIEYDRHGFESYLGNVSYNLGIGDMNDLECHTCMFWRKDVVRGVDHEDISYGICHRHAPQPGLRDIVWPRTQSNDWCGDHNLKTEN